MYYSVAEGLLSVLTGNINFQSALACKHIHIREIMRVITDGFNHHRHKNCISLLNVNSLFNKYVMYLLMHSAFKITLITNITAPIPVAARSNRRSTAARLLGLRV
jgi:hypothetical protein